MVDQPPELPDPADRGDWVVEPNLSPGTRLQISSVLEAPHLTPEVLGLLGQAMSEMQKSAAAVAAKRPEGCPRLKSCTSYNGGCPNLEKCGTYAPPGTPTI